MAGMKYLIGIFIIGLLIFGCIGQNAKYTCGDGTVVDDISKCPKNQSDGDIEEDINKTCIDGTKKQECSETLKYCNENYELEDNIEKCGCSEGLIECSGECIQEGQVCCLDNSCRKIYSEIIGSQLNYNSELEVTIINLEQAEDVKNHNAYAYILFEVKNTGGHYNSIYCSDFIFEDNMQKEYSLWESKADYFGKKTDPAFNMAPNSTINIECYQKIDYGVELEFLEVRNSVGTDSVKYTLFPKTFAEFQKLNYTYQEIGQTKESESYQNSKGPLKVTLEKIGKKTYKNQMQLKIYWKLENLKKAGWFDYVDRIFIFPYKDTVVSIDNTKYYSQFIAGENNFELANGYLEPKSSAEGYVIVPDLPNYSGPVKLSLKVKDFLDFWFEVELE